MTIPDPSTFIGKPCIIKLKDGHRVVRTIVKIDINGVEVDEGGGTKHVYRFAEIDMVKLK